jgi:hypothetical protein
LYVIGFVSVEELNRRMDQLMKDRGSQASGGKLRVLQVNTDLIRVLHSVVPTE